MMRWLSGQRHQRRGARLIAVVMVVTLLGIALPAPASANTVIGSGTLLSCLAADFERAVEDGGLITFDCGTGLVVLPMYAEELYVEDETTIDGGGNVVLHLRSSYSTFSVSDEGTLTLTNIGLTGGGGDYGVIDSFGTVILDNVSAFNLESSDDGGMLNAYSGSTTTVRNSTFVGNLANGRGGALQSEGTLVIEESLFADNSANGRGGAVHSYGDLTIRRSTFLNNSSFGVGGGAVLVGGTAVVSESSFVDNGGYQSSALAVDEDGALDIWNSTVSHSWGAGIENAGEAVIRNVTLAFNEVGIENSGDVTTQNTLLAMYEDEFGPYGTNCQNGGSWFSAGHNLSNDDTCPDVFDGPEDQNGVNAGLAGIDDNGGPTPTHLLLPDSDAIDAGDGYACGSPPIDRRDQRGEYRYIDGDLDGLTDCDIGAVEMVPEDEVAPTSSVTLSSDANTNGWHQGPVEFHISGDDPFGSGVRSITYSATGAQAIEPTTVAGGYADFAISAEGETLVTWHATDRRDNQETPQSLTVKIDGMKPVLTGAPVVRGAEGSKLGSDASIQTSVTWNPATDTGSGIASYLLQQQANGGSYTRLFVSDPLATARNVSLVPGQSYRLRTRAVDEAGNMSVWRTTPQFNVDLLQESHGSIAYEGSWADVAHSTFSGGAAKTSRAAGNTATVSFTGLGAAVVMSTGPGYGEVEVRVNGNLRATIDLDASSIKRQRVMTSFSFGNARNLTLELRTKDGDRVDIDAIVLFQTE